MKVVKLIFCALMGASFGTATAIFILNDEWGLVALTMGILFCTFYIVLWMIDLKYSP